MGTYKIFRDETPTWMFREASEGEGLVPTTLNALIIPRQVWEEYKRRVEIFYQQYGDSEIESYNQETREAQAENEARYRDAPKAKVSPKPGYIYLARSETGHHKIGISINPEKRIQHFDTQMPVEVSLLHYFPADDMYLAEKQLHSEFATQRVSGEWFALGEEDTAWIQAISEYKDGCFIVQ